MEEGVERDEKWRKGMVEGRRPLGGQDCTMRTFKYYSLVLSAVLLSIRP